MKTEKVNDIDFDIHIQFLLDFLLKEFGYNFKNYQILSFMRSVRRVLKKYSLRDSAELVEILRKHRGLFPEILSSLTVTTSEMFRDPEFFSSVRDDIFPILASYPRIKIWHAGCSSGEETYSTAILLHEAGLLEKSMIYATDINIFGLERAKNGIYPEASIKKYEKSYVEAGGTREFQDYFTFEYGYAKVRDFLKKNILFSDHNLESDNSFGEMEVIFCRNVLIYFDMSLKKRALDLFYKSLTYKGFLCLGKTESLRFTPFQKLFSSFHEKVKIYRSANESQFQEA